MAEPFRFNWNALLREFRRAAKAFPHPLYHQRIYDSQHRGAGVTYEARKIYEVGHALTSGKWQEWHGPVKSHFPILKYDDPPPHDSGSGQDGDWYGRFFGNGKGLQQFKHLAGSACAVQNEMRSRIALTMEGWPGFLELVYHIAARYPQPLLRTEHSIKTWCDDDWLEDSGPLKWAENKGRFELMTSSCETLTPDLFRVSITAIEMILDPDRALLLNPWVIQMEEGGELGRELPKLPIELKSAPVEVPMTITTTTSTVETSTLPDYMFHLERGRWHLRFRVDAATTEEDSFMDEASLGFQYIAEILRRRGDPVSCLEQSPSGKAATAADVTRIKDRSKHIDPADLGAAGASRRSNKRSDESDSFATDAGNELLTAEEKLLSDELEIAVDTGAENVDELRQQLREAKAARKAGEEGSKSEAEAARRRVKARMQDCREKISKTMPHCSLYLRNSIRPVHGKASYSYQPATWLDWYV